MMIPKNCGLAFTGLIIWAYRGVIEILCCGLSSVSCPSPGKSSSIR